MANAGPEHMARPVGLLGTIGPYQLLEVLVQRPGEIVYRATVTDRPGELSLRVAQAGLDDPDFLPRFIREAETARRIVHPGIIPIVDVGTIGSQAYVASELPLGMTLAYRLTYSPELPGFRDSAGWIRDLAMALHAIHERGLLHRDVKPSNIWIEPTGKARLLGLGTVRPRPESIDQFPLDRDEPLTSKVGVILGTLGYLSPEQARGEGDRLGPATDQYSLGCVLYHLLTGEAPFTGSPQQVLTATTSGKVTPPRKHDTEVPLGLEAIALKALQKSPWDRYPTLAEMAIDLQKWLKGAPPISAPYRVVGEAVKICPECNRWARGLKPRCVYCNCDLSRVEPSDSASIGELSPRALVTIEEEPNLPPGATVEALSRVRLGLGLHTLRIALYLLSLLIAIGVELCGSIIQPAPGVPGPPLLIPIGLLSIATFSLAGQVAGLVGTIFCLNTPHESGARGYAIASLGFDLASGLTASAVLIVPMLVRLDPGEEDLVILCSLIGAVFCVFVAWILMLAYLNRLAKYLSVGESRLAVVYVVRWLVFLTLWCGLTALAVASDKDSVGALLVALTLLIAIPVTMIRIPILCLRILGGLRNDITRRLRLVD